MATTREVTVKLKGDGRHLNNTIRNVNANVSKQMGALSQGAIGKARSGLMSGGGMGSILGFGLAGAAMTATSKSFEKITTFYANAFPKLKKINAALSERLKRLNRSQLNLNKIQHNLDIALRLGASSDIIDNLSASRDRLSINSGRSSRRVARLRRVRMGRFMQMARPLAMGGTAAGAAAVIAGMGYGGYRFNRDTPSAEDMGMTVAEYRKFNKAFGSKAGSINSAAESNASAALGGAKDKQAAFSKAGMSMSNLGSMRGIDIVSSTLKAFTDGNIKLSDAFEILGKDAVALTNNLKGINSAMGENTSNIIRNEKEWAKIINAVKGLIISVYDSFVWFVSAAQIALNGAAAGFFKAVAAAVPGSAGDLADAIGDTFLIKSKEVSLYMRGKLKAPGEAAEQNRLRLAREAETTADSKALKAAKKPGSGDFNMFGSQTNKSGGLNSVGIYSGGKGLFESLMTKQLSSLDKINYNLRKIDETLTSD